MTNGKTLHMTVRNTAFALLALIAAAGPAHAEILIGAAAPFSGPNAALGEQLRRGAQMAVDDINATGGAFWRSYTSSGNVDAGNNLNWIFGETPEFGAEYEYKLRSFTEPRRF